MPLTVPFYTFAQRSFTLPTQPLALIEITLKLTVEVNQNLLHSCPPAQNAFIHKMSSVIRPVSEAASSFIKKNTSYKIPYLLKEDEKIYRRNIKDHKCKTFHITNVF